MSKINRTRIFLIAIVWTLLGALLTIYDFWLLKSHLSSGLNESYSFIDALIFNLVSGLLGGLMGGVVLTIVNRRLRSSPFYVGLIVMVISFVFIVSIITLIGAIVPTIVQYGNPLVSEKAKRFFLDQILTTMHLKNLIFWAVVVAITHITIQVSNKFGPGNLWKMITGEYHSPIYEDRVFMFLDLKSSTAIAEKLGDDKYHSFLKDVFSDITDSIVKNEAEIYQYVGDEVVVSWKLDNRLNASNCLKCFYDIRADLLLKQSKYKEIYGSIPEFKAGAHGGLVVAGEIGVLKSEITYSGDVLNTTARIQGKCNSFNADLLISKFLCDKINPDSRDWMVASKGIISLRGKENVVEIMTVNKT